ncbi:helix-turn-helix domain-containing protein [Noviherbaspirillum sedimenti]|uniref:XRE family transcriptional regulator n=1 Tax=Noviherbaspirillum sedimenti TaxID=2320865 RepID=A0A3A3FZV3_9BURK|nr:helix-turn-helix transcriptional regulator [Noviherbaspirillum sedimenti]RJG01201.1 XRE family transcriptional regulator [Noviherbaspirillum sedimenti]
MEHAKKPTTAEELGIRLGQKIARYRKEKRMTQAMLAEIVCVDKETISRFERGTALPSLLRLFEIAQALEVGVGDLLAEASSLAQDTERSVAGIFDEISPADQKLLGQISGLLRNRK